MRRNALLCALLVLPAVTAVIVLPLVYIKAKRSKPYKEFVYVTARGRYAKSSGKSGMIGLSARADLPRASASRARAAPAEPRAGVWGCRFYAFLAELRPAKPTSLPAQRGQ